MAMMLQLIFVLSTLISITVSSDVARLVGDSVQLDYRQDSETTFNSLFWVFNGANNILKYNKKHNDSKVYSPYEDRAEFNDKTYSLTLKNLKKTDSGLYEAKASGDKNTVVAEYRLSVLDLLETPVLKLIRDICDTTLICRSHDLSISSICNKGACEEKEVTSPGGDVTLSLSVSGSTIICTLRNPVSQKTSVLEMEGEDNPFCGISKDLLETPVLKLIRDICDTTLICSGHNLSISSICNKGACEEKEVTSPEGVTLSLSVSGSTMICTLSNPVSQKTSVLELEGEVNPFCSISKDPLETPVLKLIRDICDTTFICSGHGLSISSICNKEACEEQEVTSPGGDVTLSLSVSGSTICTLSNPDSRKTNVLEMEGEVNPFCDRSEGSVTSAPGVSVLYSIILILMLSILF